MQPNGTDLDDYVCEFPCAGCGATGETAWCEPLPPDTGPAQPLCPDCWNDYFQQTLEGD